MGLRGTECAPTGSNLVTPTILRDKPFGENVEGLVLLGRNDFRASGDPILPVQQARISASEFQRNDATVCWIQVYIVQIPPPVSRCRGYDSGPKPSRIAGGPITFSLSPTPR